MEEDREHRDGRRTAGKLTGVGGRPGPGVFRVIPATLNGDLVFAEYCRDEPGGSYHPLALTVALLSRDGTHIVEKVSFVYGGLLTGLGFPPRWNETDRIAASGVRRPGHTRPGATGFVDGF